MVAPKGRVSTIMSESHGGVKTKILTEEADLEKRKQNLHAERSREERHQITLEAKRQTSQKCPTDF